MAKGVKGNKSSGNKPASPTVKPARKAVKPPAKLAREAAFAAKRKNDVNKFLSMALDILLEMCQFLSPLDILRLAQTSTALHDIFKRRKNFRFWVSSCQRLGIPDPIKFKAPVEPVNPNIPNVDQGTVKRNELSEPYYAALLFEPGCQIPNCKATCHIRDTDWKYMVRFCEACSLRRYEITEVGIRTAWPRVPDIFLAMLVWDPDRSRPATGKPPTMLVSTYEALRGRFLALPPKDKDAMDRLQLDIQQDYENCHKKSQDIARWVSDAEESDLVYPFSTYHARKQDIRARLLEWGCDLDKPWFSGFQEFSDRLPAYSVWNECIRRGRMVSPAEWRVLLPELHQSLREYRARQRGPTVPPLTYIPRYVDTKFGPMVLVPTRVAFTGEVE